MKKSYIIIILSFILVLITTVLLLSSKFNSKYDIVLSKEFSSSYSEKLDNSYKTKTVRIEYFATYLDKAKAVEMDEYSAKAYLDSGLGKTFIPSFNMKVVLVQNKKNTDKVITSLKELEESNLKVNIVNGSSFTTRLMYLSISKSLTDEFKLSNTITYLKSLNDNDNLIHKSYNLEKADYILTSDLYAKELLDSGENINIYDIDEGSLEANFGLLVIDDSLDLTNYKKSVSDSNLKVSEYENTFTLDDYSISGEFARDRVNQFRRKVLGTYKFSGVNSDERSIILILFIVIMVPWAIYIGIRINDYELRKAVFVCLGIVLSWLFLRYFKNHMYNDVLLRYIWYLNYLPLIFAPILFLNANLVMTLKRSKKVMKITLFLFIISIVMLFLVLANDIFEFAFVFKNGIENWSSYSYGFLFYVICLVGFSELIAGIVLLIKKNYKQTSKKVLFAPILIFLFIFGYIACDFVGVSYVVEMDYTLIICLFALILWEFTLRAGLVQNCGRYYSLFNNMTFDLALESKEEEIIFKTNNFNEGSTNERYSKYEISNGYAVLKDDLTVLDKAKLELEKRKSLLEKNNNTLKHEHKIMAEYYSLSSQNEILNEIDMDYKLKNDEIIDLINKIEPLNDKKEIYPYLARIKFLVSYTKQKYNCYINSKINEKTEIQTIALAVHIIMEDAKSLNLECGLLCNSMELIDSNLGVIIIDIIYMMMENALKNNSDLFVNIDVNESITVFGLFKENSEIVDTYLTNSVKALIENKQIDYEVKKVDDMLKLIFRIRSVM
ncbi:MAG: hypothetical protein J6Y28_01290 [Acholeplasmatales bacterium]|nr:hypothetical protein [Acholeplasmatales bacterium]